MKKTLIALAVLSAAGVAAAQSSVTLYGKVDLGTSIGSGKSTVTNTTAAGSTSTTTKTNATNLFGGEGQYAGNRIGLKGTEDLGGGTKLGFVYELGTNPDNTGTGQTFAGSTRQANLSVDGGFGKVTIGTFYNNLDTVRGIIPTTNLTPDAVVSNPLSGRSINSLGYTFNSGNIWAGFDVGHSNYKVTNANGSSSTQKWSQYSLGAGYSDGVLAAGLALGQAKTQDYDTTSKGLVSLPLRDVDGNLITKRASPLAADGLAEGKKSDVVVSASYKLGMFTPFAAYEQTKLTGDKTGISAAGTTPNWTKSRGFLLGTTVDLGATTAWVAGGYAKSTWSKVDGSAKNKALELGAAYALSKRTSLYGIYNYMDKKDVRTTTGLVTTTRNKDHGFMAGINHSF